MRRLGLPIVNPSSSSTHIVHLYQHGKDLLDVFAQFCCAGLQDGDCCFWITAPPWTEGFAVHELGKRLPAVEQYIANGQLKIIAREDWYLAPEGLDVEGTLAQATRHLTEARAHGWSQLRVCGSPCQTGSEREWGACLEYEQRVHRMVSDLDVLALCAYRLSSLSDQTKERLLHTHHMALERQDEGWRLQPTVT